MRKDAFGCRVSNAASKGAGGCQFHFFFDSQKSGVECPTENTEKSKHILDWIGEVAASRTDRREPIGRTHVVRSFSPKPVNQAELVYLAGSHRTAFARSEMNCKHEQDARISLGSDDGFELWLNGRQLGNHKGSPQFVERESGLDAHFGGEKESNLAPHRSKSGVWRGALQIDSSDGLAGGLIDHLAFSLSLYWPQSFVTANFSPSPSATVLQPVESRAV